MASTYLSRHYQLVFATRNREAAIAPKWRSRMHEYLGGIKRNIIECAHPETNYSTCWRRPELNTIPDISSNRSEDVGAATPSGVVGLVRS
jgi:hypothetical protein